MRPYTPENLELMQEECDACGAQSGRPCKTTRWNGRRPHPPRTTSPHDSRRRKLLAKRMARLGQGAG